MAKDIAIVIGYKGINSTGLIRSLGEAGYHVVFASSYSKIESKYTMEYWYLPENEKERIQTLHSYLKKLPLKAALFTGDDTSNIFIEKYYDVLSKYCYCPRINGGLLYFSNKMVMANIAKELGLHVPESRIVDLAYSSQCPIDFPIIIKPYAGYAGRKIDIKICHCEEDYKHGVENLRNNGYTKVIIQQFLDSDDKEEYCLMGFSIDDGTVKIPCTIQKIRSYPLKQGSLSFGHVKNNVIGTEIALLEEFVKIIGYIGIFDIDIIMTKGILYFIEINFRNGQNGYVSTAAGYNIPDNWFKGMQKIEIDDVHELKEVYYMNEHCDYRHILEGNLNLFQWGKNLMKTSVYAMYNKHDLRPYIRQYIRIPEKWKKRLLR